MKHTYNIKMRAALWAMLGIACLATAPAMAGEPAWWTQQKRDCGLPSSLAYNNWDGKCNSSPGGSTSTPSYDYGAAQRAQEAAKRKHLQEEADRIERERLAAEKLKKEKDAAFIRDRDAAANTLKGSSGAAMNQLKGLAGTDSSGLKGSGFDQGSELKGLHGSDPVVDNRNEPAGLGGKSDFKGAFAKPASHTDTSVVDARVPHDGAYLTDRVPELKNSPAADRITKGFQAVINHDWPAALAWWQDALNRDPNNAALKRSVDLAQWMVDKRKAKAAGPVTPLGAAIYSASHGDSAKAIRQFELVKAENPAIAPQVDDMINALRQRQTKAANDAKVAAYWSEEIKKGTQKMVDEMFETGMNRLSIGDEEGAQEAFNDATFFGLSAGVQPSQLPAPKPVKAK